MKFTVREYSDKDITVDFDDGSWAVVPATDRPLTRAELCEWVMDFNPEQAKWGETLPFQVGETIDFNAEITDARKTPPPDNTLLTYVEMRRSLYPSVSEQADAAYWQRQGDDTHMKEIDEAISEVKRVIPKHLKPMTRADFVKWLSNQEDYEVTPR